MQQIFGDGGAHHIIAVLVQISLDRGAAHEDTRVKGRHVPGARISGRVAVADGVGGLVRAHIHPEVQLLKRGVSVGLEAGLHRFAAAGDMRAGDVRHHDVAGDPLVHVGKSGVICQHLAHDLRHVQKGARARAAADAGHDHHIHAHRCASCMADFHRSQAGELGFEDVVYFAVIAAEHQARGLTVCACAYPVGSGVEFGVQPRPFAGVEQHVSFVRRQDAVQSVHADIKRFGLLKGHERRFAGVDRQVIRAAGNRNRIAVFVPGQGKALGEHALDGQQDIRACAAQADYQKRIIQLFHPVDRDIQLLIHDDIALNHCFGHSPLFLLRLF